MISIKKNDSKRNSQILVLFWIVAFRLVPLDNMCVLVALRIFQKKKSAIDLFSRSLALWWAIETFPPVYQGEHKYANMSPHCLLLDAVFWLPKFMANTTPPHPVTSILVGWPCSTSLETTGLSHLMPSHWDVTALLSHIPSCICHMVAEHPVLSGVL